MSKLFFTIFISFFVNFSYSQTFSSNALEKDILYLVNALKKGHPKELISPSNIKVEDYLKNIPDSLSNREYEQKIRNLLFDYGCVHTAVDSWKVKKIPQTSKGLRFPLNIFCDGKKLFYVSKIDSTLETKLSKGDEILSINGKKSSEIIEKLMKYHPVDGYSTEFGTNLINQNFRNLFAKFIEKSDSFEIVFQQKNRVIGFDKIIGNTNVAAANKPVTIGKKILQGNNSYFSILQDTIGFLKIYSFKKGYKKYYKNLFEMMKSNKIKHLIVDVRDNFGGSRSNANELISYLSNEPCSYALIRPKNDMFPHLTFKYKMQYIFSYVYFDVFQIFKSKKTAKGKSFVTKIFPKKNKFVGNTYVLMNGYSGSSSTVFTSFVKHYGNAKTIGQQTGGGETFNCGGSYPMLVLPASKMKIKTATFLMKYDIPSQNLNGIIPDYEISYDVDAYQVKDLELLKAIELIKN